MKVDITEGLDPDRSSFSNDHLLVRELTNRINNEFASVIGLVSLVAARSTSDDVKDALSSVMSAAAKTSARSITMLKMEKLDNG
jgi:two-component sensor histidine kinase